MERRQTNTFWIRVFMGTVLGVLAVGASDAWAQCYGGPCPGSAHKPGQVSWLDAALSNAGWGEGPPCSDCHTTTHKVERPERTEPAKVNFKQEMNKRDYLDFHRRAARLTKGRGPLKTLPLDRVPRTKREEYRWVLELLKPRRPNASGDRRGGS